VLKELALPNGKGKDHKRHKTEHKRHNAARPRCASCVPFLFPLGKAKTVARFD
jgi:hypothetical protein